MSNWYRTGRRRGPKPNTRRARGLPKRDKGKPKMRKVIIPDGVTKATFEKYLYIYSEYVKAARLFDNEKLAMEYVSKTSKFKPRVHTIKRSLKYVQLFVEENKRKRKNTVF